MIIDIHKSFKIQNKLIKTITDNGRNFVKAFRMFEDKSSEIDDDFQFVDIDDILNNRAESFDYLPQHSRCACHNLNLVATVDAEKALGDRSFQIVSQSLFQKCQSLWNKQNMSTNMADEIIRELGRYLICPNSTRRNSYYESMVLLDKMLDEKQKDLDELCDNHGLIRFNSQERKFIKEYSQVMEPMKKALKILEGELHMDMGFKSYHF
ncbi:uncharacterized protein LOC135929956 [Gordionus sp. m RMFG-2023]|uniref:uncharacterized protein LOC135929955 n=1 Tax=Gordionus sp. m RMFG-2023 TaxID=3053472 RepID=UPI0031FDF76C